MHPSPVFRKTPRERNPTFARERNVNGWQNVQFSAAIYRPSRYGADENTALSPLQLAGTGNRRQS